MNFKEFEEYSKARSALWDKNGACTLEFDFLQMAGEVGEACNIIKKYLRTKLDMPGGISEETMREMVKEELADIFITLNICTIKLNIDLEQEIKNKFNKDSKKHGFPIIIPESL